MAKAERIENAEHVGRGKASPFLVFLIGALIGAILVVAWFVLRGGSADADLSTVNVEAPRLSDLNMPDQPKLPKGLTR